MINQRPVSRRSNQHRKRRHKHAHAQIRANIPGISRYLAQTRTHQTHNGPREESIHAGKHDDGRMGFDGLPADAEDAGADAEDAEEIEPAEAVGGDARDDAAEEGGAVEDGGEVEGELRAHAVGNGVGGEVEDGLEDA